MRACRTCCPEPAGEKALIRPGASTTSSLRRRPVTGGTDGTGGTSALRRGPSTNGTLAPYAIRPVLT
eukprot:1691611-Rhodomonas_salina.1